LAYVPHHVADVFISYCHDDDFVWIERFQQELRTALVRKLRARTPPAIFFDAKDLRAGRVFDDEIRTCLARTAFFVAMISPRYNGSEYCMHKEMAEFLRHHPRESGRLIQVRLDLSAALPVDEALAVSFAGAKGVFRPDSEEYAEALRRVYEPIVTELDKLYAGSKMVFLAWPGNPQLEEERQRLKSEIDGRNMRVFPAAVAEFEGDVRLRDALQQCVTSVHFFGQEPQPFDLRQWEMAVRLNRPCIIASQSAIEARRGPAGSPAPVYFGQGDPTKAIADAIEQIAGIGRREERDPRKALGRTPVFLSFNEDSDAMLGLELGRRISTRGPFEVITPRLDGSPRFEEFNRAKAALLCRRKAAGDWLARELQAVNTAMAKAQMFSVRRALYLPGGDGIAGLEILEDDAVLHSLTDLEVFLNQVQGGVP
jgi:hypothetical protein